MALQLLDTTALIDLSKGFEPTTSWITERSNAGDELGVSPITIAEFYAGLTVSQRPTWDEFFVSLTFCPISYEASVQAGKWRAEYRSQGIQLSTTDALVAAVAADVGAVVVTSNVKHYPMPLRLIDPRRGPSGTS